MTNVIPPIVHLQTVPRSANRGAWIAWLYRRTTIPADELFVAMLISATPNWKQWPLISLDSKEISRRIEVEPDDIEAITDQLVSHGFLRDLQDIDEVGRRRFLAILPPLLPGDRGTKW